MEPGVLGFDAGVVAVIVEDGWGRGVDVPDPDPDPETGDPPLPQAPPGLLELETASLPLEALAPPSPRVDDADWLVALDSIGSGRRVSRRLVNSTLGEMQLF